MVREEKQALLAAILSQVIFGFSFMFTKVALNVSEPLVLLAIRFDLAFLLMNLLVWTGKLHLRLEGKPKKWLIVLGILQPVIYFIGESFGIKYSNSSFAGVMIALIPILTMFLGVAFLHEKASVKQVGFAFLSVGGVIMTAIGGEGGSFTWFGFAMLLMAIISASFYTLVGRKIAQDFTATERCYAMFAMGSVTFTAAALVYSAGDIRGRLLAPLTEPSFWLSLLYLVVLSSVGAYLLQNFALTYLSAGRFSIMANITTVISLIAGAVFLNESFTLRQVIASVIILVGVYGVNRAVAAQTELQALEVSGTAEETGKETAAQEGPGNGPC